MRDSFCLAALFAAILASPLAAISPQPTDVQSAAVFPAVSVALPTSPTSPDQAPVRDARYWPQGYFPGDPLPPSTIYFSFDDGPTDFTPQLLDILKEEGVHATFFLNSYDKDHPRKADASKNVLGKYKETLQRMVREGHAIGNHSYSHQDFALLSPPRIDFQLSTLQRQLKEVLGAETPTIRLIRPPFGSPWLGNWNTKKDREKVARALSGRGIVMLWTVGWDSSDSADWAKGEWFEASAKRYHPGSASYEEKMQREMGRILRRADGKASGVILMHDTHPTSRDVLKALIEELKRRGYSFATLEDYCRWRWGPDVFGPAAAEGAAAEKRAAPGDPIPETAK
jgi:peptidoglycan/xylan/chitin deacetylase (PgdA/CDA1 family)